MNLKQIKFHDLRNHKHSTGRANSLNLRQEDLAQGKRSLVRKVNTKRKSIIDRGTRPITEK